MAVELGAVTIERLTEVSVAEVARIATHDVPGMTGSLSQMMGRPSVEVTFSGIVYGPAPLDDLKPLRDMYLAQEPVDFFTEAIGEGYFAEVLIRRLEVTQRASYPGQLDFRCVVTEFIEPPEPAVTDPFAAVNTDLVGQATAFVDTVQDSLAQVSQLVDLLSGIPGFADPTARIGELGADFVEIVEDEDNRYPDVARIGEVF